MKEKITNFLSKYGYRVADSNEEFTSYENEDDSLFGMDIYDNEIVFISDEGDFLHLPLNIFALVGALVYYRQIPVNFSLD